MADPKRKYFEVNSFKRKEASGTVRYGFLQRPAGIGASAYRDELGDILTVQRSGAGITLDLTNATVNFDYNAAYNANPALADFLYKNVQLNHDRTLSANLLPHLHWIQEKNFTPNFLFEYRYEINGGAYVSGWTKLKCTTLAFVYPASAIHQISYSAGIAVPGGSSLSDIIQFRIYRDTTNASGEFTGVCPYNTGGNASTRLMSFDVHINIDQIGSTQEYVK